jgi:hypothetical protein
VGEAAHRHGSLEEAALNQPAHPRRAFALFGPRTEFTPPRESRRYWQAALDAIEYDPTAIEITKMDISQVVGQELGSRG